MQETILGSFERAVKKGGDRMKLVKGLFVLSAVFSSYAMAGAYVAEVNCQAGGCLKGGWVIHNLRDPGTLLVDCVEQDCMMKGWTEQIVGRGGQVRTFCESEGCFHRGFTSVDRMTGREIGRTRCLRGVEGTPQCLTGGWVSQNTYGQQATVTCKESDCDKNGWEATSQGQWLNIVCKEGGCFQTGWWVYQN